jgi:hypothetical protein
VTRNTGDLRGKDSPDGVTLTVPIKDTNLSAEVALQANTLHGREIQLSRAMAQEREFFQPARAGTATSAWGRPILDALLTVTRIG